MKNTIKKSMCAISAFALSLSSLTACSDTLPQSDKISIVTTVFAEYDWARQIVGDSKNVQITLLSDNGADLHSFEPTADDIITISDCDIFIYIGGESDKWVEDVLKQATNEDMITLNLLEIMGDNAKFAETVEGMQDGHEHGEDEEHEHYESYDEHIWLSLKNASFLCEKIAESIISLCPEDEAEFTENLNAYKEKLNALDEDFSEFFENTSDKTVLFGDRFPFLYLFDDYSIDYFAAFSGCSSESEASFDTITFLANKLDTLQLGEVLTIEGSDCNIAETVISASTSQNIEILTLDSMQSVTKSDIENGASYLSYMENNFNILKSALS